MAGGTMGGTPKKGGSMLPAGFVEDKQREKELGALDESANKQGRVDEDKEEQKEEVRKKKIDDLLPETVLSAYGEVSYEQFKKIYADVFEGVEQKDHWATGFVEHDANLPGGVHFKMRNFRRSEGDAIRSMMPRTSVMEGATMDDYYRENSLFVGVRVVVAMMSFDGNDMVPLPTLTIDGKEKWLADTNVKKAFSWLDNFPDQLVTFLDGVVNDIMVAYNAAATENLKNQLAPLSDSTE